VFENGGFRHRLLPCLCLFFHSISDINALNNTQKIAVIPINAVMCELILIFGFVRFVIGVIPVVYAITILTVLIKSSISSSSNISLLTVISFRLFSFKSYVKESYSTPSSSSKCSPSVVFCLKHGLPLSQHSEPIFFIRRQIAKRIHEIINLLFKTRNKKVFLSLLGFLFTLTHTHTHIKRISIHVILFILFKIQITQPNHIKIYLIQ
jgi:hypothetical protein